MDDSVNMKVEEEDDELLLLSYLLQPQEGGNANDPGAGGDLLGDLDTDPNFLGIGDQLSQVNTGMEYMFRNRDDGEMQGTPTYDGMDDFFYDEGLAGKGQKGNDLASMDLGGLGLDMGLDEGLGLGLGTMSHELEGGSRLGTGSGASTPSQMAMSISGNYGDAPKLKKVSKSSAGTVRPRAKNVRKPKGVTAPKSNPKATGRGSVSGYAAAQVKREASMTSMADSDGDGGMDSDTRLEDDGLPESEEKRQRRLARNRESARQSRRRKKKHLELLEEKVSILTKDLDDLRRASLDASSVAHENRRQATLKKIEAILSSDQPNKLEELQVELNKLQQRFGSNTAERRMVLDYHYNQITNLMLPPYTKFLLWMMNQGEDFFDTIKPSGAQGKGNSGLWPLVSAELGLNEEQQEKLKQNYKGQDSNMSREECNKLSRCLKVLELLRRGIDARAVAVQAQSDALSKILTPEQNAKYVLWVERNRQRIRACGLDEMGLLLSSMSSLSVSGSQGVASNDPKFEVAQALLQKPDNELQLSDLESLLAVVEG